MEDWNGSPLDEATMHTLYELLNGCKRPIAWVTADLMVIGQNTVCARMLYDKQFYSLYDYLPDAACDAMASCIRNGQTMDVAVDLIGERWDVHVQNTDTHALLIFHPLEEKKPMVLQTAQMLRERADALLLHVFEIEMLPYSGAKKLAMSVKKEAMQLLRQSIHLELLGGSQPLLQVRMCEIGKLMQDVQEQMDARGVGVELSVPEQPLYMHADPKLVESAVMTLLSNSLRHNTEQEDLHICLIVQSCRDGEEVSITVEDNGKGIADAGSVMNAWRDPDYTPSPERQVGLGLAYARRIAELHGGRLVIASSEAGGCKVHMSLCDIAADLHGLYASDCYHDSDDPAEIELSVTQQWYLKKKAVNIGF